MPLETISFANSETLLNDPALGVAVDFSAESQIMVVACAGFAQQIGLPPFEFFKLLSNVCPVKKIFLRDTYPAWYQRGITGLADTPQGVADALRPIIAEQKTTKLVMIGNSGGAFGALLFGALLNADRVLAISPPTTAIFWKRALHHNEWRWLRLVYRQLKRDKFWLRHLLWTQGWKAATYPDLVPVLRAHPQPEYHIHYAQNQRTDSIMAERIRTIPSVHLHPYNYEHHSLIQHLKKSSELAKILDEILSFVEEEE